MAGIRSVYYDLLRSECEELAILQGEFGCVQTLRRANEGRIPATLPLMHALTAEIRGDLRRVGTVGECGQ